MNTMLMLGLTAAICFSANLNAQHFDPQAILEERLQAETNRIVGLYSSVIDIGPCAVARVSGCAE